ncbi:MAG: hypothetical protein UX62_C0001G0001 [Microgenomates group bacterium GW2011_GWA2_46_7]|nr:MAG: hypothetical protein UX62_C0001G0001 [Microgenomates group bacterium GW2011_GWA2_46_7]
MSEINKESNTYSFQELLASCNTVEDIYRLYFDLPKYTARTEPRSVLLGQLGQRASNMPVESNDRGIHLQLLSTLATTLETSRLADSSINMRG